MKRDTCKQRRLFTFLMAHKWIWVSCGLWIGILLVLVVIISTTHPDLGQPIEFLLSGKEFCCPRNESRPNPQGKLSMYPKSRPNEKGESFVSLKIGSVAFNVKQIQKVISEYPKLNSSVGQQFTNCWLEDPTNVKPCLFERNWLGNKCTIANQFGYGKPKLKKLNPCIFFRIENTGPWRPDSFNPVDMEDLNDYHSNFVKLQCDPKNQEEKNKYESLSYWPSRGFPRPFFPASNHPRYLTPGVMLRINGLRTNVSLSLQCWLRIPNAFLLEDNGVLRIHVQP